MSQEANQITVLIKNNKDRLQKLKETKATKGINVDPSIILEIEKIEEELRNLEGQLNTFPNTKNRINEVREKYLRILEKDVKNRLKTSIHQARFIDIQSEQSLDSTHLPWIYQTDDIKTFTSFEEAFDHFEKRVLVLGAPGSGKTTVLLNLAETLIKEAQKNLEAPIPLLFNLSKFKDSTQSSTSPFFSLFKQRSQREKFQNSLDENDPVEEWLIDLTAKYPGVTRDIASDWVEKKKIALLLDGLDEFDDQQLDDLALKLNSYLHKYPELTVVICSRIVEYQALKDKKEKRLQLTGAVTLQPLNQKQIDTYLEVAQATSLRDAIANDTALYEMAQTPLTLSVMTLAYAGLAPNNIPTNLSLVERRQHLFDTYIDRMMQRQARREKNIPFDQKEKGTSP